MHPRTPLALVLAAALPLAASAESFRCGSRVVSTDSTTAEILKHCGQPDSKTSTTEDIRTTNQYGLSVVTGKTTKQTWVYNRGSQAQSMVVVIIDGRVKSIERAK